MKLDRGGYIVPLGDMKDLASASIFDVDPDLDPTAKSTEVVALFADHHAEITTQEPEPTLGRPTHFVFHRAAGNTNLWPRCDQTYWFRATFRAPIGHKVFTPPDETA